MQLLTILGVVHASDAATLQDAVSKSIAAVCVIAANTWVVIRYIQSRTSLKQQSSVDNNPAPLRLTPMALLPWLALALLGGPAASVQAATPSKSPQYVPACLIHIDVPRQAPGDSSALMPLLQQMIGLQQQGLANQQAMLALLNQPRPASPPSSTPSPITPPYAASPIVIEHHYYSQPLQELPGSGKLRQDLPVEARPRQELPPSSQPRQVLPEAGKPLQDVPEAGKLKQELPVLAPAAPAPPGTQPATPITPTMPPAATSRSVPMQRYTIVHTLWK